MSKKAIRQMLTGMHPEAAARYLIGVAVLRYLENGARPEVTRPMVLSEAVAEIITGQLTPEEYHTVLTTTGFDFAGELTADERIPRSQNDNPPEDGPGPFQNDDIPF